MDNAQINNVINTLKSECSENDAYLGFVFNEINEFDCQIKANKEGLILHAMQLMEASLEIDKRTFLQSETYKINNYTTLDHSDFLLSEVEFINHSKKKLKRPEVYKQTFKDKLGCLFGFLIISLIVVCLIVGFFTSMNWLFS